MSRAAKHSNVVCKERREMERDGERWREMERGWREMKRDGERWREMKRDGAVLTTDSLSVKDVDVLTEE